MTTAVLAARTRLRPPLGPALGHVPFPAGTLALSALAHLGLAAALVVAAVALQEPESKTYVVNLVPAVAAVGAPQGRPAPTPTPPARVEEPAPRVSRFSPAEMPAREAERPPERPVVRDTTPRELPSRPASPRSLDLPDRRPPATRAPALPRPGDKEAPAVASAPALPRPSAALPAPALPAPAVTPPSVQPGRREPAPAPAPPLGRPTGAPGGSGAITLSAGDFPHAWYLRLIERKIQEAWRRPPMAREGQEMVALFEIGRDGQVRRVSVERTSGDTVYDQAALRAISDANPFPPLPEDFRAAHLRVHLGFTARERG